MKTDSQPRDHEDLSCTKHFQIKKPPTIEQATRNQPGHFEIIENRDKSANKEKRRIHKTDLNL